MHEIITEEYFEGQGCTCYATSANECGCEGADWTPTEVYKLREDAKQLALERDEALSQIAQAECRAERYCQERDEARDALMKIEDLFIDGTDIYADRENMGTIAREALEDEK
jgi:hypothetical protein